MVTNDGRRVSETLGTGQHVDAPFGGTVKDIHASCRDEIERLREELVQTKNQVKLLIAIETAGKEV